MNKNLIGYVSIIIAFTLLLFIDLKTTDNALTFIWYFLTIFLLTFVFIFSSEIDKRDKLASKEGNN